MSVFVKLPLNDVTLPAICHSQDNCLEADLWRVSSNSLPGISRFILFYNAQRELRKNKPLNKRLYHWMFGSGTAGGITAIVLLMLLWFGNRSAMHLLVCFAKYPIEISVWLADRLLGSEAIAPTQAEIIVSDVLIVLTCFIQWALIGTVIGGIFAKIPKRNRFRKSSAEG